MMKSFVNVDGNEIAFKLFEDKILIKSGMQISYK